MKDRVSHTGNMEKDALKASPAELEKQDGVNVR